MFFYAYFCDIWYLLMQKDVFMTDSLSATYLPLTRLEPLKWYFLSLHTQVIYICEQYQSFSHKQNTDHTWLYWQIQSKYLLTVRYL